MDDEEPAVGDSTTEEVFVVEMRRRRGILGISQADLADRVVAMGGSMYQQTIAKIEAGQRSIRLQEADIIARALKSSVPEMLSAEINAQEGPGESLPIDELVAELSAASRREQDASSSLLEAKMDMAVAQDQLDSARQRSTQMTARVQRIQALYTEVRAEHSRLSRDLLSRQEELRERYGSTWLDFLEAHGVSTTGLPKNLSKEYLRANEAYIDKMSEYALASNRLDKEVIRKEIVELRTIRDAAAKAADRLDAEKRIGGSK